jgi:predicted aspartyl protease
MRSPHLQNKAHGNAFALLAFATTTLAGPNRKHRGHKNQCIRQLECWLTIFLVLLAIVLAAAYYAYCVYGKSTRSTNKETEPLMPVATATPMT